MSPQLRVLLDTNVLITYLLDHERKSPATRIVEGALMGQYTALISDELLFELATRVERKAYLAQRIFPVNVTRLTGGLVTIAERIDLSDVVVGTVVRDPDDDYLIALALTGRADVLVTGDRDLLAIADRTRFSIISVRDFADLLDTANATDDQP